MLSNLLQIPLPDPSVYDELSADGITPRPHWAPFVETLQQISSLEFTKRWERAERRIRENGVTYNIYGDPLGANRPWRIDLLPLLIPHSEWVQLEAGIKQRAELLNIILQDFYGRQKLLRNGSVPPELLFANPGFLRPVAGLVIPQQNYLHLLAVDLARSPDGQWWVLADRAQAPSGTGYALENRTIVADILPDLFRTTNVQRLARFFQAEREALIHLAGKDNPSIVLLTPGPFNETYFEHSYLARYLGFTLVEGADLTVRDRHVFLKTVQGLRPVDVIVRRVDDSFCDPLELRGDSFLGIAGLVDCVAAGNVKVANALGSGVVETPALMPFLPGLARQILGETLKLPSVATWWCGQKPALDWVLSHLDQIVVKPAFPARAMEPVFGAALARAEREEFSKRLRARPLEFVAQEQVKLSAAPVWDNGHIYSRSVVLRMYALNTGSGWRVMPGALVRVAGEEASVVSMQRGGHSKDAWILSDKPIDDPLSLLRPRTSQVEIRRASVDLPSRVADNLFWLGRYAERSENMARILRTIISRVRRANGSELKCLVRLYGCLEARYSTLPKKRPPDANELEAEFLSIMTDTKRGDSLASALAEVHRVGGNVRERLSTDMTRLISQLTEAIEVEEYMLFGEQSVLLTGCLELLSAFSGMERENITRGPGWLFLSLGRRLERAMYMVRMIREIISPFEEADWPVLEYLLEVADSSITYRSRYFTTLQPVGVLDILMMDEVNPRGLAFQLSHLVDLYGKLPRHMPEDLKGIRRALSLLNSFDLAEVHYPLPGSQKDPPTRDERARLDRALRGLARLLPSWSNNLSNTYFSHARSMPTTIGQ